MKEAIERSAIGVLGSGTGLVLAGTDELLSVLASVSTILATFYFKNFKGDEKRQ